MPGEINNGTPTPPAGNRGEVQMQCSEFEALLMEVLDGELNAERRKSFDAHQRSCALCGPMFAEVQEGQAWLRALEPVEPPPLLVHNILAATSGVSRTRLSTAAGERAPLVERLREWWDSWFSPFEAFVRQPRFVMSFGMIFFTFSLVLSAAGVKPADMSKIDLRPAALRHAYNDAQIKMVHYYDNIRFVYEIESKVRELKRATTPAEPAPVQKKENHNNDTSGQPEQRQDLNYSREQNETVLAALLGTADQVHGCELRAMSYEQTQAQSRLEAPSSKLPVLALTMDRRYL